jgi:hypothetical protein
VAHQRPVHIQKRDPAKGAVRNPQRCRHRNLSRSDLRFAPAIDRWLAFGAWPSIPFPD